ncbi:MAG: hypothetical protein HUJ51_04070, partial [Eggerthellaceae bacterium]|nr:hypothetical protein [Eggerthellaceae bacterium]
MATTKKPRSNSSNSGIRRKRKSFARIPEGLDVPNLIDIQKQSFRWFLEEGVKDALEYYFPIKGGRLNIDDKQKSSSNKTIPLTLELYNPRFVEPEFTPEECKRKSATYMIKLYCDARLTNNLTGEVIESVVKEGEGDSSDENSGQFLGEFMMMTEQGTFIVNGNERCVVSQLVKSPGVFFETEPDKTSDVLNYKAKIVPSHGSQLEFETDKRGIFSVRIDRKRKQPATVFIRALGIAESDKDIIKLFGNSETVLKTLDKDPTTNQIEALIEIYKKIHPGEQISIESAKSYLENQYFNKSKYDLARVGRYMINKKLGFDEKDH